MQNNFVPVPQLLEFTQLNLFINKNDYVSQFLQLSALSHAIQFAKHLLHSFLFYTLNHPVEQAEIHISNYNTN